MIGQFIKFFSLGFFPEELPPEFGPFGITEDTAKDIWDRIDEIAPIDNAPSHSTLISFPKSEFVRRDFHFFNPLNFARLAHTILDNWDEIKKHTDKRSISTSRLDFSDNPKQIFEINPFSNSVDERISRSTTKNYVLYIDIANFYPSIYTHSIDWALNNGEKRHYSEHRNRDHVGEAIDEDVRRSQDNITNGIAIGPVTSRIISEIISCYFDDALLTKFPSIKGARYVDDLHVYLNTKEQIEQVQVYLQKILSQFRLKFNEAKISTGNLPEIYSDSWTKNFSKKEILTGVVGKRRDFILVFSKAFELLKSSPKHPALRYLFRVLESDNNLRSFDLSLVMEMVNHSLKADSSSISRACIALSNNNLLDSELEEHLDHFEPSLFRFSELGYSFEVLWLMHLYLHSGKIIPDEVVDNILNNNDKSCIAYLFICWKNELITDEKINSVKEIVIQNSDLYEDVWKSPYWLLAYEDKRQEWDLFNTAIPEGFQRLLNHGISFLMSEPNKDASDIHVSRYEFFSNSDWGFDTDENEDLPF